ncbi:Holliday junction branch migration protein RuvA [uncultured Agrococcus sp.]|uniref:Holliday junction branch migration protein RuvA n=1 Tax=uncultured Agrococcus sp. TaxID=382258 RepID=UPI0025EFCE5D|nr:Holliday junction branch migration protein RuvA [uncultured Agrococcus sp.]
MIAHLEGTVLHVAPTSIVLSVQGVGFAVTVTPAASAKARIGAKLALHTKLIVREDDLSLFGFDAETDREAFELLTSVSGVGPKSAMAVLSTIGSDGLAAAVDSGDEKAFKPVPGIGPKLAKLIMLQLSGKLITSKTTAGGSPDMVEALVGLGWQEAKAQQTLQKVLEDQPELDGDSSGLLRAALRILGGTK